jgi:hypothetical protein
MILIPAWFLRDPTEIVLPLGVKGLSHADGDGLKPQLLCPIAVGKQQYYGC